MICEDSTFAADAAALVYIKQRIEEAKILPQFHNADWSNVYYEPRYVDVTVIQSGLSSLPTKTRLGSLLGQKEKVFYDGIKIGSIDPDSKTFIPVQGG